jgi:hypothetical protein
VPQEVSYAAYATKEDESNKLIMMAISWHIWHIQTGISHFVLLLGGCREAITGRNLQGCTNVIQM